jgi:hypothetical protein
VPIGPGSPGLPVKGAAAPKGLKLDVGGVQGIDTRISMSISPEETRRPSSTIDKPLPSPPFSRPPAPPPPAEAETLSPVGVAPETPGTPTTIASPVVRPQSALSSNADGAETPSSERRRGVTLVDHPLALPHHAIVNASRFSFEESSKSGSAAQSQIGGDEPPRPVAPVADADDDDRSSFADDFQFDLDDEYDDDDGFERANEGLFENDLQSNGNADQSQLLELTAAVSSMMLAAEAPAEGNLPIEDSLPTMDPQPAAVEQPSKHPSLIRRKPMANPRGLDLSDDSDLDYEDEGLAGYEDEDDDLYYDDGFITEMYGGDEASQNEQPQPQKQPEKLTIQPPINEATPAASPPGDDDADGSATAAHRLSFATGFSSGLVPQDGSMATQPEGPTPDFPPFINPVGGGLGFTPQQPQFYAPNVSGTMLNGYALSSLTATLQQYQLQQQIGLAGAPQSPSEGYDSDINERPNFGANSDLDFDFDDLDGDDAMVAAANADALAYDSEGFYGTEFGFYPSNIPGGSGLSYAGGFFGAAGANGDLLRPPIRRPSLTPISERSECSYRNSLVFPVAGSLGAGSAGGWGSVGPLTPGSWGGAEPGEDLSLGQLLQLRRNAWGGSNGSMHSSGSAGGGSPVGWPEMGPKLTMAEPQEIQQQAWMTQQQQQPGESVSVEQMYLGMMSPPLHSPPAPPPGWLQKPAAAMSKLSPPLRAPPPPPPPPGLGTTPPPPGLQHAGNKAMLPTKGSFEDPLAQMR